MIFNDSDKIVQDIKTAAVAIGIILCLTAIVGMSLFVWWLSGALQNLGR
jgi:hypothetical protein